jgi:hypothetical protein
MVRDKKFYWLVGGLVVALAATVVGTVVGVQTMMAGKTVTIYRATQELEKNNQFTKEGDPATGNGDTSYLNAVKVDENALKTEFGDDYGSKVLLASNAGNFYNHYYLVDIPKGSILLTEWLSINPTTTTQETSTGKTDQATSEERLVAIPITVSTSQVGGSVDDVTVSHYFVIYGAFTSRDWAGKVICRAAVVQSMIGSMDSGSAKVVFGVKEKEYSELMYASQNASLYFISSGTSESECEKLADQIGSARGSDILNSIFSECGNERDSGEDINNSNAGPLFFGQGYKMNSLYVIEPTAAQRKAAAGAIAGFDLEWMGYKPDYVAVKQYAIGNKVSSSVYAEDGVLRQGTTNIYKSDNADGVDYMAKTGYYYVNAASATNKITYDSASGVYRLGHATAGKLYDFEEPGLYHIEFIRTRTTSSGGVSSTDRDERNYYFFVDWGANEEMGTSAEFFGGPENKSAGSNMCVDYVDDASNLFAKVNDAGSFAKEKLWRKEMTSAVRKLLPSTYVSGASDSGSVLKWQGNTAYGTDLSAAAFFSPVSIEIGHVFANDSASFSKKASDSEIHALCGKLLTLARGLDFEDEASGSKVAQFLKTTDPSGKPLAYRWEIDDGTTSGVTEGKNSIACYDAGNYGSDTDQKEYASDTVNVLKNEYQSVLSESLTDSLGGKNDTSDNNRRPFFLKSTTAGGGNGLPLIDPAFLKTVLAIWMSTFQSNDLSNTELIAGQPFGTEQTLSAGVKVKTILQHYIGEGGPLASVSPKLVKESNNIRTYVDRDASKEKIYFYDYLKGLTSYQIEYLSQKLENVLTNVNPSVNGVKPTKYAMLPWLAEAYYDAAARLGGADAKYTASKEQCLCDKTEMDLIRAETNSVPSKTNGTGAAATSAKIYENTISLSKEYALPGRKDYDGLDDPSTQEHESDLSYFIDTAEAAMYDTIEFDHSNYEYRVLIG